MQDSGTQEQMVTSAQAEYDARYNDSDETPCPYLPQKTAQAEAYAVDVLEPQLHEHLMNAGFRRSGHVVYRPRCRGCDACTPVRVRVNNFHHTRSMKRTLKRNLDVTVHIAPPVPTRQKHELFARYLAYQHDGTMSGDWRPFTEFLYCSPTKTLEFTYRLNGRIIAVSIADRCVSGLSSVYAFFDPQYARRSLGTYSILREIAYSKTMGFPYYYLGFWVAGSRTMDYKCRFGPNEFLVEPGVWQTGPHKRIST